MYGEQWNKRDLRSLEHAPLDTAEKPGLPYRFFFIGNLTCSQHPTIQIAIVVSGGRRCRT